MKLHKKTEQYIKRLIETMEQGGTFLPYVKPGYGKGGMLPYNAISGKPYRGGNMLMAMVSMMLDGYTDPRFMTFRQAKKKGYTVKKGEHGIPIKYVATKEMEDKNGEEYTQIMPKYFTVFNAQQIEGFPELPHREPKTVEWCNNQCEAVLARAGTPPIIHEDIHTAYYRPSIDQIHLPLKEAFTNETTYYTTALHELAHSTGHKSRLNRETLNTPNSDRVAYAREELVAELSAYVMACELGVGFDPEEKPDMDEKQHAIYLQSFIKLLKEEPDILYKTATQAEEVCKFLGIERYQYPAQEIPEDEREVKPQMEQRKPNKELNQESEMEV